MHPIERLRWIARTRGEDVTTLASETAWTLSELAADEPQALVTACRRLLDAHPTAGPMWWVAARLLVAPEPEEAARSAAGKLCSDPTAGLLAASLAGVLAPRATVAVCGLADTVREALGHRPDCVVRVVGSPPPELLGEVRSLASSVHEVSGWDLGEARAAVEGASLVLVEALVAGPQGVLAAPGALRLASAAKSAAIPVWGVAGVGRVLNEQLLGEILRRAAAGADLLDPEAFDLVVGPAGDEAPAEALGRPGCPDAPELLARVG